MEGTADPSASLGMTKGEQCFGQHWMLMERTADPSASLGMTKGGTVFWSGLDADGGNCRSLGFARDDKGGNSVLVSIGC